MCIVDKQAHPVMRALQNEQGTSDQSDASESTDATSKVNRKLGWEKECQIPSATFPL